MSSEPLSLPSLDPTEQFIQTMCVAVSIYSVVCGMEYGLPT